jgi:hypothetical protein
MYVPSGRPKQFRDTQIAMLDLSELLSRPRTAGRNLKSLKTPNGFDSVRLKRIDTSMHHTPKPVISSTNASNLQTYSSTRRGSHHNKTVYDQLYKFHDFWRGGSKLIAMHGPPEIVLTAPARPST